MTTAKPETPASDTPTFYWGTEERYVLERLYDEQITVQKAVELLRELGVGRLPPGDVPGHEVIAEMLPSILASSACPLCGQSGFHQHSPTEIVIYRNGVKYGRSLCAFLSPRAEEAARSGVAGWQPIETAPKDGTLLLLLIGADEDICCPVEDTYPASRTIGHNNFDNDGEDEWQFAGWNWEQDHYTKGRGTPIAWRDLAAAPEAMRVKEGP